MQHSDAQLYNTQKFISSLILPMTGNIGLNRRHHYNDQPYIYKFYFKDIALIKSTTPRLKYSCTNCNQRYHPQWKLGTNQAHKSNVKIGYINFNSRTQPTMPKTWIKTRVSLHHWNINILIIGLTKSITQTLKHKYTNYMPTAPPTMAGTWKKGEHNSNVEIKLISQRHHSQC